LFQKTKHVVCCFVVLRNKTKGFKQKDSNKSIQTTAITNTVPKQNIWAEKIHQRNERIEGLE